MPLMIEKNVPLARLTTIGLGGTAEQFTCVRSEQELLEALKLAHEKSYPVHLLGGGSNLVVSDSGVSGLVIHCQLRGLHWETKTQLRVAAGESWDSLTDTVTQKNLTGIECLGGIPGQVGSTPIQNVGAYGQEVSQTIQSVHAVHRRTFIEREFSHRECQFDYRNSYFKEQGHEWIITSVLFEFSEEKSNIRNKELAHKISEQDLSPAEIRKLVIELRRAKSMVLDPKDINHRSCGSFFVNLQVTQKQLELIAKEAQCAPPSFAQPTGLFKVPSAWLIERAGFKKGYRRGNVGLSTKHTLAITAQGEATTQELLTLANEIQLGVLAKFGVNLIPEPRMWGFEDEVPAITRS